MRYWNKNLHRTNKERDKENFLFSFRYIMTFDRYVMTSDRYVMTSDRYFYEL